MTTPDLPQRTRTKSQEVFHHSGVNGVIELQVAFAEEMGDLGGRTNPEEL